MSNRKWIARPGDIERAVIFDLGGVVLDWRPRDLLERFYAGQAPTLHDTVWQAVFEHPDWLDLDRGTLSHRDAAIRFAARAGRTPDEMARLLRAARDSLQPLPETLALMRSLEADGVPLYCLSNMHAEIVTWLLRTYDFWPLFRGVVFSSDERLIKPDPVLFDRLLSRYGLVAANTAFVDDHPANIESAARIGLHAIRFENAVQTGEALERWFGARP